MPIAHSNKSLSLYSFIVKHLGKGTTTTTKEKLSITLGSVLIAESIGHSFGKFLSNALWILDKAFIKPGCQLLG